MKNRVLKNVLSVAAVLLVYALLLSLATVLLKPKYMTDLEEGSFINQYYREAGGHDVVFTGDCEVYANFSPLELYREKGITAYVRGSSQQLIWQSYYVLKETLRYETPKAVVWNVNAMRYGEDANVIKETYNRLAIDQMRWSTDKIGMIRASMTKDESFLSYVFPLLRYHSRFDELTSEDLTYFFTEKDITWNGHLMNQEVKPAGSFPAKRPLGNYDFPAICYDYLNKMRELCEENGVELILVKAPSLYPYWYDELDARMEAYAAEHDLTFYNFTEMVDTLGIDYTTDTYDGGYHLNLAGAKKLSAYFAEALATDHGIPDRRNDPAIKAAYDEKLARYDEAAKKGIPS